MRQAIDVGGTSRKDIRPRLGETIAPNCRREAFLTYRAYGVSGCLLKGKGKVIAAKAQC